MVGRNGSGKSSFAEALELLLTGSNRRWEHRSEIWKEGWRNLHHTPTRIEASFIVEGRSGRVLVTRAWADGAALTEGVTTAAGVSDDGTLAALGWRQALTTYRPFLPHSELGALWDEGPAKLHDALASILGLEDLTALIGTLAEARLAREQGTKRATADLAALRVGLGELDDERARVCLAATGGRSWDLDAVATMLDVDRSTGPAIAHRELALLRDLAALPCPRRELVEERVAALRSVATQVAAVAGTDSGRARATATLLRAALDHVGRHHDTACPVCGAVGTVGADWRAATALEIARLGTLAVEADRAHGEEQRERQLASALIGSMPPAVRAGADAGIDTAALLAAWAEWVAVDPSAPVEALADHLEMHHADLAEATTAVRAVAATAVTRREDAWRPLADQARHWLARARDAMAATAHVSALKAAETWVKAAEKEVRAERFAPVAAAVRRNWETLRQDSSVSLDTPRLEGTRSSNLRRVVLAVSIDGAEGAALGVMSQGELNALALSLFLPRASLPESPFRFIVIDDPVQAMDPAKVDGLARVLANTAASHQVVVFTHDERLPSAIHRLGIEARILEVVRREASLVEVRAADDPVHRHIEDAFAVARDEHLPVTAGRVVPTFCRMALEAACADVVMRRRLARGDRITVVETLLANSQQLSVRLALLLFDDSGQGSKVAASVDRKWGDWARTVVSRCTRGAHEQDDGDLVWLCTHTRRLAAAIQEMR